MSLIRIERNPSRRQLAVFGIAWLVFFAAWGGMALAWSGLPAAAAFWGAAVLVPAIGWLAPSFLRCVYVGMAYAAFPIGLVVSLVILAGVYYSVLTPIGLLMRLLGHDPMSRRRDANAASYWASREPVRDIHRYFRQF